MNQRKHLQALSSPQVDSLRTTPHHREAEVATLGALMLQPEHVDEILSLCRSGDFYNQRHQLICEAIESLHADNLPTDTLHVFQRLQAKGTLESVGGMAYLSELGDRIPFASNACHYAKMVADFSIVRRMLNLSLEVVEVAYKGEWESVDSLLDMAERGVMDLRLETLTGKGLVPMGSVGQQVFQRLADMFHGKVAMAGLPTYLSDLDKLLGGLQRQDLIYLGGRPSMGKTATALQIGMNISLRDDEAGAIFSLEMSHEQLYLRQMANRSGVLGDRLFGREPFKEDDLPRMMMAASDIQRMPTRVCDEASLNLAAMRARLNRYCAELAREGKRLAWIIVDYIQIMGRCSDEGGEAELSTRSQGLKQIAKDYDVPVIALSQLNRELEKRPDKRPIMSDLRGSGSLEQDADVIIFAYRDEVYHEDTPDRGLMELIVAKHRNGPVGTVKVRFDKPTGRITDQYPTDGSF